MPRRDVGGTGQHALNCDEAEDIAEGGGRGGLCSAARNRSSQLEKNVPGRHEKKSAWETPHHVHDKHDGMRRKAGGFKLLRRDPYFSGVFKIRNAHSLALAQVYT